MAAALSSASPRSGSYDGVSAAGRSTVVLVGTVDGASARVQDEALLDLQGYATSLDVAGGRAILSGGTAGLIVDPGGHLDMRSGDTGYYRTTVIRGTAEISGGYLGVCDLLVTGYAEITGGRLPQVASSGCLFSPQTPPWGVLIEQQGRLDLRGGELEPSLGLAAREESRIRIFGANFAVDGTPVPYGSLEAESGRLTGTLETGGMLDNPFAQRGGDCGPATCEGRIAVLAGGEDWDADGVENDLDNCAEEPNPDQADEDDDGRGDACDVEDDPDGWQMTVHGELPSLFQFSGSVNGLLQAAGRATDLDAPAIAMPDGPVVALPLSGWESGTANGINELGIVTGNGRNPDGEQRGFVGDVSGLVEIPTLGGDESFGEAINDRGHVVGHSRTANGERHGFYWDGSSIQDLGTLGSGDLSIARALSDSGFATGQSRIGPGSSESHAFFWDGAGLEDLGTLGGQSSVGFGVSENGYVAGRSDVPDGERRAFFWDGQQMIDLGELAAGEGSSAQDVSSAGWVTGTATTALGDARAFVWDGIEMVDLGAIPTAWDSSSEGLRILENGTIVGISRGANRRPQVVTWTEADGVPASMDNCPAALNPDQSDRDGDGIGDACNEEADADGDDWADPLDNCPLTPNPHQIDRDGNGIGKRCQVPVKLWASVRSCSEPRSRFREKRHATRERLRDGGTLRLDPDWSGCFGLQIPGRRQIASAHFRHVGPDGSVTEDCVEGSPLVLGLGPRSDACGPAIDVEGTHSVTVTAYDAPGCEAGEGAAQPVADLGFTVSAEKRRWHDSRAGWGRCGPPPGRPHALRRR